MFGRNYLDLLFIVLCTQIHLFIVGGGICFHCLTTRKDGDRYLVRVQYDDVDLEMEVEAMYHYIGEKLKESS